MAKEKILFIINPISGVNSKVRIPDLIQNNLDLGKYDFEIQHTRHPGHATELTKEGILKGFRSIVAVGGDGTINEIARVLVNTETQLGIIPSGSGNGLSRQLGIPLNPVQAIRVLNQSKARRIDSGSLNDNAFFCTAGVGFDAHVGRLFAESPVRGLSTYVKTTIREFRSYKPDNYKITVNGSTFAKSAFTITFANSGQYGNNAYISPEADIQDGLLDICILKPFPKYKVLSMGSKLFRKTIHKSSYLEILRSTEVKVERECVGPIHLDGEPAYMGKELKVKIFPASLSVVVPS